MASAATSFLRLSVQGQSRDFVDPVVVVGRERGLAVTISHPDVSRRHAEFRKVGATWYVVDLGSTNGTWLDGRRLQHEQVPADRGTRIRLGGADGVVIDVVVVLGAPTGQNGSPSPLSGGAVDAASAVQVAPVVPLSDRLPAQAPPGRLSDGHTVLPPHQPANRAMTIGRSRTCDVVIDDALVSRRHATLTLAQPPILTDLGSFNGTFVNGYRLTRPAALRPGDEVTVGNQAFTWTGDNLAARATQGDLTLYAENLTTVVKGGRRLLDGMSFELGPSSLTAVIGPSGAGKSTLLGALTGATPATHGQVVWQGSDLYTHYEQLRYQIGLVPQQDIQHPQLTVRQGLTYAAMLRLPPDTSAAERASRVDRVVGQMQLHRQVDNRIGTQLSGGQKKRVSIATELLTAPPLLFLDEPTSGLDPGLDRDVMQLLRTLADEGRVVMVVTHSVLALDVCDNVLVLAPGGRRAYFGPPAGVLEHFGCADYPAVFDLLDDPDLWRRIPPPPAAGETSRLPAANAPVAQPPVQSLGRQLTTLVRRNLAVTFADKMLLTMLLVMPLVLGALSRVVQGDAGLSLLRTANDDGVINYREALQRLTILIVAAALMGTAVTIRELVKERAIFQREYAVGLSPGIYLASKVIVLGTACFAQGMLVTWLATVGLPGPDDGGVLGLGSFEVALAMGGVAFAMAVLGLAVSALVTSSEQTMPALVGVVMVQLVLCGALVPVAGRAVLEQLAWLAPARWGFAAAAVSTDLDAAKEQARERGADDEQLDTLYDATAAQWFLDLLVLWLLVAAILIAAWWLVRRSAVARR